MPGYLTPSGIESCVQFIAASFPAIAQLLVLPETSIEGRACRALKIAKGAGTRRGILFIGGVHARELVNPDLLVNWSLALCQAYTSGAGMTFGPKTYDASTIKLLVEALDIFVFPLVNPDGRQHVQSADAMWRKNRSLNPGQPCRGVDINRNYDFLWSSGIGTSGSSCSDVFKGPGAFSEPETRNVRSLLDANPNIECLADVHSYSELVLYPWGDDNNQSTDPSMNFLNPAFNGLRGNPGDSAYKEFIPASDETRFKQVGEKVRDAIAAVRGRVYTVEQGVLLYPTSGTSKDYGYSRHFVDASKRKVFSFVLETAREFQPPSAEAQNVMTEVGAGLVELCNNCLCFVEQTASAATLSKRLHRLRTFRDKVMASHAAGRRLVELLESNTLELILKAAADKTFRQGIADLTDKLADLVAPAQGQPKPIPKDLVTAAAALIKSAADKASPKLRKALDEVVRDLPKFSGKTVEDTLRELGGKGQAT